MAKEVETESISIILENGEQINVEFPDNIADELFSEMREAQSRDEFWWVGNWTNARAMYKGVYLDHINMKRVIGFS